MSGVRFTQVGVGLESHTTILQPPNAINGCLLSAFALLASGLAVAFSILLSTMISPGQGILRPQKRRLTKPFTGVDLGRLG